MSNEKNKVEALLFAAARRMKIEEISNLTGIDNPELIQSALNELKAEYDAKGSSMTITNDGEYWKLTIKDHYLPIIKKVVSQTELDKPLMETLAVIAWKYPVVQSEVIKIRHNKAYDHMRQLEELGFVTRQKFGRTNKITLTQKFFEYFDLPSKEAQKEVFKNIVPENVKAKVEKAEKEIDEAERQIQDYNKRKSEFEEQRKKEKEQEEKDRKEKKEAKETEEKEQSSEEKKSEEEKPEEIKEDLEEEQEKEDKEIENMEEDLEEIKKEEDKNVYSEMPEVQESDEVPESDNKSEGKD
jgi:segregation and condensation protein B